MTRPQQFLFCFLASIGSFVLAAIFFWFNKTWIASIITSCIYGLFFGYLAIKASRKKVEPYYFDYLLGSGLITPGIIGTVSDYLESRFYSANPVYLLLGFWYLYRGWKLSKRV